MRNQKQPSPDELFALLRRQRRQSKRSIRIPAMVLAGAAILGTIVGLTPGVAPTGSAGSSVYGEAISGCAVTDGDTIRCEDERIRLLGIDAPELPGHCRAGRNCAPGDPYASTASLGEALRPPLTIDRVGEDHYGRTLARVAGSNGDLSCWQLEHNQASYVAKWDDGLRIARNRSCDDLDRSV
jgi:hypothetical protein